VETESSEQEMEQEELALWDRNGKKAKPKISAMHLGTFSRKSLKPLAHNSHMPGRILDAVLRTFPSTVHCELKERLNGQNSASEENSFNSSLLLNHFLLCY
jgi:hypothetical protein